LNCETRESCSSGATDMSEIGQSSAFIDRRRTGRSAPIPAVRETTTEPQGSTLLGHSGSHLERLYLPRSGPSNLFGWSLASDHARGTSPACPLNEKKRRTRYPRVRASHSATESVNVPALACSRSCRPRPLGLPPRSRGWRNDSERRPRRGHSSAPQPYRPGWRTAASASHPAHRSP
jgi:hypothetical protein